MLTIITLYLIGLICLMGWITGGVHFAIPAVGLLILATRILQDWWEEQKENNTLN